MATNLTGITKDVRDIFLKGVYNETFEVLYNGGPECAKESSLEFKFWLTLRLVPWYLIGAFVFYKFMKSADERKSISPVPSILERLMGLVCFGCYFLQIYLKIHSNTLIFILNPCHLITLVWAIILTTEYSKLNQVLFLYAISNIFSPYIGMVFAENDELIHGIEIMSYWVQHSIAAVLAPFICLLGGRFAHKIYSNPLTIICGYQLFTLYMRLFLAPVSALTWANLNHTLCGIDNDPWRKHFKLEEYYYFWAEFYLGLAAMTSTMFTIWLARCLRPSLFNRSEFLEQKITNVKDKLNGDITKAKND